MCNEDAKWCDRLAARERLTEVFGVVGDRLPNVCEAAFPDAVTENDFYPNGLTHYPTG